MGDCDLSRYRIMASYVLIFSIMYVDFIGVFLIYDE